MKESDPPRFVDREPQLSTFCDLLKSERSRSVMLVRGDPAIGKTRLLERFEEECRSRSETPPDAGHVEVCTARVDFRSQRDSNQTNSAVSLIRLLRDRLGQPSYFGRLDEVLNEFTERGPDSSVSRLQKLADRMEAPFDLTDLMQLSRYLDVPPERWLMNVRESENAYLMAEHFHKKLRRLPELVARLEELRPDVDWREGLEPLLSADPGPDYPRDQSPAVDRGAPLPVDGGWDGAMRQINGAFFECLNRLSDDAKLIVFLFDGCGLALDAARSWIRESLLRDGLGEGKLRNVVVVLTGEELVPVSHLGIEHLVVKKPLDLFDRERVEQFLKLNDVPEILNLDEVFSKQSGVSPGILAGLAKNFGPAQRDRHVS